MTLDEVVAGLIEVAKANVEKVAKDGGDFCHVAFPLKLGENIGFSCLPLPGDKDKRRQAITDIHANLEHNGCNALVIISDAWATTVPQGMDPMEALRQKNAGLIKPRECLITLVVGKDIPAKTITNIYTREGTTIKWDKQEETDQFESWTVPPQWRYQVSKGEA